MEFGKRDDMTETMDFCRASLLRTCYRLVVYVTNKRGKWCNGFRPYPMQSAHQPL